MLIAIDGPAAAGKGTLAKRLAEQFELALLDTGLLYRAVGKGMLRRGEDINNPEAATGAAQKLRASDLEAEDLREEDAAMAASKVSVVPGVRAALLEFQRNFAETPPDGKKGSVLDGRDIGTVVCPDANVKLFITASAEIRAERRYKELRARDVPVIYARILEDVEARDARDRDRSASPLVAADDAVVIDTSDLDADGVLKIALGAIGSRS